MTGINEKFIPISLLNQVQVDKDSGELLAGGTVTFYRDTSRATKKAVYALSSSGGAYSYAALPNPITLSSVGTFQDAGGNNVAVYAFPYLGTPDQNSNTLDLYYIECKNSAGTSQWTREAIPNLNTTNDPVEENAGESNMLSNAQFSRYFLTDSATTIAISGATNKVYPIAPDWDLVLSGTGNVVLTRTSVSGSNAIPTYPAYYLDINLGTGVTSGFLRQRLSQNSGIWSGKFISGFVAAKVNSSSPSALTMKYKDSSGSTLDNVTIFGAQLTTDWDTYGSAVQLDDSNNTQSGNSAYVDVVVELPLDNTTSITSIQTIVSESTISEGAQAYDNRTANREQALMGDYYIPRLEYKNVPSLLVGWDFPLNPAQFGSSGTVTANTSQYIWDQTILQTSTTANIAFSRATQTSGLKLRHTVADQSYALIQYLDGAQAAKFVGTKLSVNINGYTTAQTNPAQATSVQVKMFANSASNQFGTLPTSLVTINATTGEISLTSTATSNGWYEITRNNLPTAKGNLGVLSSSGLITENNDIGFNNWEIDDNTQVTNGVQGVAVVASFTPAGSSTEYNTHVDSLSVVTGDIPTRPAPLSKEETLESCQYYFEKSYATSVVPGASNAEDNALIWPQDDGFNSAASAHRWYRSPFIVDFKSEKRTNPTSANLTIYDIAGSSGSVRFSVYNGNTVATSSGGSTYNPSPATVNVALSSWTLQNINTKRARFLSNDTTPVITETGSGASSHQNNCIIEYHYRVDARIGVI